MAQLAVSRLRLRGPPALAFRANARAEEALRLAAPEGERLLVLRRLALGRLPVTGGAALWEARAGLALREAGARAVHALSPGAAAVEAVWFASVAEARWLLLRELAAGRWPEAWFWRLAVPGWRGLSLAAWVPRLIAAGMRDAESEVALARAVLRLAEAGLLPRVVQALEAAPAPPRAEPAQVAAPRSSAPARGGRMAVEAPRLAVRLMDRHAAVARARLLAAMRAAPPQGRAAAWLARLALLAAAPEAAAQPDLLVAMTEAVIAGEGTPAAAPRGAMPQAAPAAQVASSREAQARPGGSGPLPDARPISPPATPRRRTPPAGEAQPDPAAVVARARPAAATPDDDAERFSRAAGVLLLVRPLARMGLPGWLDRHPVLAASGFVRALLRHVALRMRVPAEDPLLGLLPAEDALPGTALDAWRVGLDRWLRRRARRRLAEVARRPGWLACTEDRIAVRFPADAADARLRRLALDVDPGWVPWLGLAIRYHFRDDAVP
ncbi:hypothetical protein [Falsiroseomonas sp.]|uniref:hypothetical protein n=1 Tax=Falsiroseomonas sp. TaxID=2870721 RepID=UPI003566CF3A